MAVYNGEDYLREAVDSVLLQTFSEFEFVVMDDGSTDDTAEILASYDDPRLRVIRNSENRGLPETLNKGVDACRSNLIARMDSDDICEPKRLEEQMDYMEKHPEIAIVGSWVTLIGPDGRKWGEWKPEMPTPGVLFWETHWMCPLFNLTVVIRKEWFLAVGGYADRYVYAQDYDLLVRIIQAGGRMTMIPKALARYRSHPAQISTAKSRQQARLGFEITHRHIQWLLQETVPKRDLQCMLSMFCERGSFARAADAGAAVSLTHRILDGCLRRCSKKEREHILHRTALLLGSTAKRCLSRNPASAILLLKGAIKVNWTTTFIRMLRIPPGLTGWDDRPAAHLAKKCPKMAGVGGEPPQRLR